MKEIGPAFLPGRERFPSAKSFDFVRRLARESLAPLKITSGRSMTLKVFRLRSRADVQHSKTADQTPALRG